MRRSTSSPWQSSRLSARAMGGSIAATKTAANANRQALVIGIHSGNVDETRRQGACTFGLWQRDLLLQAPANCLLEMLGQLQALPLVVGFQVAAVQDLRHFRHLLVDQPADDLAVLKD